MNSEETFVSRALGPHKYLSLAVMAPGTGMIGAMGIQIFCHQSGPATLHGSYYALVPAYRGCGISHLMIRAAVDQAVRYIANVRPKALDEGHILQFIETNDIAKMTLADRLEDEAIAMHPLDRDRMWEARCFREIRGIDYRQRARPPRPLALKVHSVDVVVRRDGQYWTGDLRAPDRIPAATVLRHVRAFDNLLMNFDEAEAAVRDGHPLIDPRHAGLLADVNELAMLNTVALEDAKAYRLKWAEVDRRIQDNVFPDGRALTKTMTQLAQQLESSARG